MRVLVLDGNENQAVACVRSLARAGHRVLAGADTSWSKAGWSRHCRESFVYPSPNENADAFVKHIAAQAAREPGTLVLPMTERSTLALSERREEIFAAGGRMILPSHETVLRAFSKVETTRLAASMGIPVPQTTVVNDRREALKLAASFGYPAVLKAACSEQGSADGKINPTGAPRYARDAAEFISGFEDLSGRSKSVIAQEFIHGIGVGYFALMNRGELRAEFAHRRIRDVRPTGSGSALRVSMVPTDAMREAALKILGALNWHGVAMVEFRMRADGTPVFLEVNGRFWTSLALAIHSGVDFPALLARMVEDGDVEGPLSFDSSVRCRWLLGDFRHLIEIWRGKRAGYPENYPGRFGSTIRFLWPASGTHHDNFELSDPMPEIGDWLDFAFRRLPAELRKRNTTRKVVNVQRRYSHS